MLELFKYVNERVILTQIVVLFAKQNELFLEHNFSAHGATRPLCVASLIGSGVFESALTSRPL